MENQNEIEYSTNVIIDGKTYFRSLAHQLAKHLIDSKFEGYRLTAESLNDLSVKIYIETVMSEGSLFQQTKYSPKKCIGVIIYDINENRMTLRKTNVNREIHEFHADGVLDDCFGVQYDIFRYLRDSDLIQIHTVEKVSGENTAFCYTITKSKAARNGRFLHFKGHGKQFFIPIADFRKSDGKKIVEKRKTKGRQKNGRVNKV